MRAILSHRVAESNHRSPGGGNCLLGDGTTRGLGPPLSPLPHALTAPPGRRGTAVLAKRVAPPPGLVPTDDLVERAGEEGGGERARNVDGVEEVAGCRAGVDLVEEPHPFLGEGERADRFLLKRRHSRSHGLSGQRAGGSFRQGFHDQRASHGGGPAGYCPSPSPPPRGSGAHDACRLATWSLNFRRVCAAGV